jgi:hypothetical protein
MRASRSHAPAEKTLDLQYLTAAGLVAKAR